MKFGEVTGVQILLTAFSGFGVFIISWIFGKKIIGRFRSKDKQSEIIQRNNETKGDMVSRPS